LAATIGDAALMKNSLTTIKMCPPKEDENGGSLKVEADTKKRID
jgi:hypothetical protein